VLTYFKPSFVFYAIGKRYRNMTRSHARSPVGQRAHCENSLTRGTRISTIGALGYEGLLIISD